MQVVQGLRGAAEKGAALRVDKKEATVRRSERRLGFEPACLKQARCREYVLCVWVVPFWT